LEIPNWPPIPDHTHNLTQILFITKYPSHNRGKTNCRKFLVINRETSNLAVPSQIPDSGPIQFVAHFHIPAFPVTNRWKSRQISHHKSRGKGMPRYSKFFEIPQILNSERTHLARLATRDQ
jgi:hypothetical protein